MSHGLRNAQKASARQPSRCLRVFIPKTRTGSLNYRRTCLCGLPARHKGEHVCPDCGGRWGSS